MSPIWMPLAGTAGLEGGAARSRRDVVGAVDRWTMYPLADGHLVLDRALAHLEAGDSDRARADLESAGSTLGEVAEAVLGPHPHEEDPVAMRRSIALSRLLVRDLATLLDAATEFGRGELAALRDEIRLEARLGDQLLAQRLAIPLATWVAQRGGSGHKSAALSVPLRRRVDLHAVPARSFVWRGPLHQELTVTIDRSPAGRGIVVTAPRIRPGGAAPVNAFVRGPGTDGLRVAPLLDVDTAAAARFDVDLDSLDELVVGVGEADRRLDAVADRATGLDVDVERLMIESWAYARLGICATLAAESVRTFRDGPWVREGPSAESDAATALDTIERSESISPVGANLRRAATALSDAPPWGRRPARTGIDRPLIAEVFHVVDSDARGDGRWGASESIQSSRQEVTP